jgi:hypothetical protein
MEKRIRLTESELNKIVENSIRRAINEGRIDEGVLNGDRIKSIAKTIAKMFGVSFAGAVLAVTMVASGVFDRQYNELQKIQQASDVDREEFGEKLKPASQRSEKKDSINTTSFTQKGANESRINRAVMESIRRFKKNRL